MSSEKHGVSGEINLEVLVTDDNDVYVKLSGFESAKDADKYAEYLSQNLSLMLFETTVMH